MQKFAMIIWRSSFLIVMVFIFSIFSEFAHASKALGCNSGDKSLSVGYLYYEGHGLWTVFGDFNVHHQNKKVQTSIFNWLKWDDQFFRLNIFSWNGLLVKISAEKADLPDGWYRIKSGFIIIEGKKILLDGIEIECMAG